jgi:hypothetical protein
MKLLADGLGKSVEVTSRATVPASLRGVLVAVDETCVLPEMPGGSTVVSLISVLHVVLREEA